MKAEDVCDCGSSCKGTWCECVCVSVYHRSPQHKARQELGYKLHETDATQ